MLHFAFACTIETAPAVCCVVLYMHIQDGAQRGALQQTQQPTVCFAAGAPPQSEGGPRQSPAAGGGIINRVDWSATCSSVCIAVSQQCWVLGSSTRDRQRGRGQGLTAACLPCQSRSVSLPSFSVCCGLMSTPMPGARMLGRTTH